MAKNKSIFVEGFMDSFSEDKRVEREKKAKAERKKEEAERKKEEARGSERTEEDARGTEGTIGTSGTSGAGGTIGTAETIGTGGTTGTSGTKGTKGERGARGDGWRKVNRPVQKTIFFDKETSMKLNMLKEMQGKPVQDVIYDIVRGWLDENYEEAIKG